jgi:integrase
MSRPEKRIRNGKVRWYARYYDPSGRQLAKTFNRQVDAERFLRQIETAKDNNNYVDPAREDHNVGHVRQMVDDTGPPEAVHPRQV